MQRSAILAAALLLHMVKLAAPKGAAEPWVDIISPTPAQLFIEGQFTALELHFRVHSLEMGAGAGVANVYVIRHAMSYGGDAFRGREHQRASPDARVYEAEARIQLDSLQLDLGLHQVRVHLVEEDASSGQEREVAESAAFFEIRLPPLLPDDLAAREGAERSCHVSDEVLSEAFDEKAWLPEEGEDLSEGPQQSVEESADHIWREYVRLHARMLDLATPAHQKRFLILDQSAGGLGNRLGSVISGLLLAMLSQRALLVHWDLTDYLLNGDATSNGIRWQFASLSHIRELLGEVAVAGVEYLDMGELASFLTCSKYTVSEGDADATTDATKVATRDGDSDCRSELAAVSTLKITNPHYYVPLIVSNPHYRKYILDTLGAHPTHELMVRLYKLAPYLQAKVDTVRKSFNDRPVIGLQIRQARWCGKVTLPSDGGGRTRTNAYMTEEHHALYFACAHSLLREYKGQAVFFVATDMPHLVRPEAQDLLGRERVFFAALPDDNVHESRAAMEEGRRTNFDGAFLDIWLLASCNEVITTPASSFGYVATALSGTAPVTVTKWGKCLRAVTSEPMSHAWPLVQQLPCFDRRMHVPEFDMMCQDCVVLSCACGDLTCASHSEPLHPLFPRQVAQVVG
jgi:hypothetical protein